MARNINIVFGPFAFAMKYEGAVEKPVALSNLCVGQPGHEDHEPSPFKAPKTCDHCGPITDYTVTKKGLKSGKTYRVIEQSDVAEAKEEFAGKYDDLILAAHPSAEILARTEPGESLNYLTPADASGQDHYKLLVKLVEAHPEVAFTGLYTPVSRTSLYVLQVRDGVLMLQSRVREQGVKVAPSVGGEANEAYYPVMEFHLSQSLTDYDPEAYEDRYQNALNALLEAGTTVEVSESTVKPSGPSRITDTALMEALTKLKAVA